MGSRNESSKHSELRKSMVMLVSHFSHRPILTPGTQPEVLGGSWVRLEP